MNEHLKAAQDYFKIAMDSFEKSRDEAKEIKEFNNNKHYTIEQLTALLNRKQPAETFNIIKAYKRVISGYLSSTINNIDVIASHPRYTQKAVLAGDIVNYVLKENHFDMFRNFIQDEFILSGLVGYDIIPYIKNTTKMGIPEIDLEIIPISQEELGIDPLFSKFDYSDGRFIHYFKWVPNEELENIYPPKIMKQLKAQYGTQNIWVNNFDMDKYFYNGVYNTKYNSLIVKTQYKKKDKIYEVVWCGDVLIYAKELPIKSFSIRPFVLEYDMDTPEYYGLFREVIESQKAINQALIQIQLLVNTNKVFVNTNSLVNQDLKKFTELYNRVNSIIPMKDLNGVRIDKLNGDIVEQYKIIDAALQRIKMILNLNDSFLGMAGSSASGRQVKLQQNMTASAMQYLTIKINFLYEQLAKDILENAKIYFRTPKIIKVTDAITGTRYAEINKPITINGKIQWKKVDIKDGKAVYIPWVYKDTTIDDLDYSIQITTANYNETDDMERIQLDSIIQGPAGQMLLKANPAAYANIVAIQMKSMKTRNSEYIAKIFDNVANQLAPQSPTVDPRLVPNTGNGGNSNNAAAIMSAAGMTNDAQPAGYNAPKG